MGLHIGDARVEAPLDVHGFDHVDEVDLAAEGGDAARGKLQELSQDGDVLGGEHITPWLEHVCYLPVLVEEGDLRLLHDEGGGGAALVLAGLGAGGETYIRNCGHIYRGYENICRDLSELGARIYGE